MLYVDQTNGTILLGEKVICPNIPHPTISTPVTILGLSPEVTVQEARDGTLIRMFYTGGNWVCATNYSLDLKTVNVRLGQTKPFQTMIEEAMAEVGLTFSDLDTGLIYFFMLEHPDNIIILQHQRPNLSPVMTARLTDVVPYYEVVDFCAAGLLQKTKLVDSRVDSALISASAIDSTLTGPVTRVGIIVNVVSGNELTRFRINTPEYDAAKALLSTNNNKSFRCLQILCDKTKDSHLFKLVFPNYAEVFAETERQVLKLCKILKNLYKMTFVDSNDELVYGRFMKTLYRLKEHIPVEAVNITAVRRYILKQDAALVAHLLNIMKEMDSNYTSEEMDVVMAYD